MFVESSRRVFVSAFSLITLAAVLVALGCFGLVQGVLLHLKGEWTMALFLYLFAWVALGTGVLLFAKGRKMVMTISPS